jgi:hypothetical protein
MRYDEPKALSKDEAERVFASRDLQKVREALVSIAFVEPDWRWVQDWCLAFTARAHCSVRAVAATCLGHLARIHGQLDTQRVMPRLELLLGDPETTAYAETAIDDVLMFVGRSPLL